MDIQRALRNFSTLSLKDAARKFLSELGYRSDKSPRGLGSSPAEFEKLFISKQTKSQFDKEKAAFSEWKSADLIFQYTDAELSPQHDLLQDNDVSTSILKSYIFISIELQGSDYARGKFSSVARQINRLFPQPVMVLIKHGDRLTIAIINRRYNKLDHSKDVLGKVTLIRDINISQPHRGHIDILTSLALKNLKHPEKKQISDFDTLHAAWEQVLNVELLNQRFYRDLSNWYFWALDQVEFPSDLEKDDEKRKATGLIRLLTRLIFCWFLKEKGLVPETLFNVSELSKSLRDFEPESEISSTYYQAVLQNLFFATLNQRIGKDGSGKAYRGFATDAGNAKNKQAYDINGLYRYQDLFVVPEDQVLRLFEEIPFLNGGLFECLDRIDDTTGKITYVDGFSSDIQKRAYVPNRLFFDGGETADLSGAYGDTKRTAEHVEGLVNILQRYKFTIVENTPIDQEIALDPELLGKVFENLLASYNEETKTTARKQTGSFYTPRLVVDYMVDESIKSYLLENLTSKAKMTRADAQTGLGILFAYTEREHAFSEEEVSVIIKAVDELKILDPACGSGAFPMGVLHKLVYILGKLDPDNVRWRQAQLSKLDSAPMREELEKAFSENNDDYGRKLHLIENCLYGTDIQPIAIQITKLRFFISLVCDQKTNRDKKNNLGVRALPNLETKFVAANTLIFPQARHVDESLLDLTSDSIHQAKKKLGQVRHQYFVAQNRREKLALQKQDRELRRELSQELERSYAGDDDNQMISKLSQWDPFDPQYAAGFFDPEWMFGHQVSNGFDIVIGNPPYVIITKDEFSRSYSASKYPLLKGKPDLYRMFLERSVGLLAKKGTLSLIIPNTILGIPSAEALRRQITLSHSIQSIIDLTSPVFGAAAVNNVILQLSQTPPKSQMVRIGSANDESALKNLSNSTTEIPQASWLKNSKSEWTIYVSGLAESVLNKISEAPPLARLADTEICLGMQVYHNTIHTKTQIESRYLHSDHKKGPAWIPELSGRHIGTLTIEPSPNVDYVDSSAEKIYQKPEQRFFKGERIILREILAERLVAGFTSKPFAVNKSCYIIRSSTYTDVELKGLLAILSSTCISFWVRLKGDKSKQALFPRITMNTLKGIPIPKDWKSRSSKLSKLVDAITDSESRDASQEAIANLFREIDLETYDLFGLTESEIKVVESR